MVARTRHLIWRNFWMLLAIGFAFCSNMLLAAHPNFSYQGKRSHFQGESQMIESLEFLEHAYTGSQKKAHLEVKRAETHLRTAAHKLKSRRAASYLKFAGEHLDNFQRHHDLHDLEDAAVLIVLSLRTEHRHRGHLTPRLARGALPSDPTSRHGEIPSDKPDDSLVSSKAAPVHLPSLREKAPQDGRYQEHWPNRKRHIEGQFRSGQREGRWEFFHEKGRPAFTVNYQHDVLHGKLTQFRIDGSKLEERTYQKGRLHGRRLVYDARGRQQLIEQSYQNDQLQGREVLWYPSGKRKCERQYHRDQLHGRETVWYASGNRKHTRNYDHGQLNGGEEIFYPSGPKFLTRSYHNGTLQGSERRWHENGKLKAQAHYHNGRLHGRLTEWDEAGNKVREQNYNNGKPVR